jgi:hypothetical protein
MQSQWTHGKAYYRCRYRDDYPVDEATHPPSIYVKEDAITPGLDAWLASLFHDEHIDDTCAVLAGASEADEEARGAKPSSGPQSGSSDMSGV